MVKEGKYIRLIPVDVLILRGNKLFAGAGQHGESVMPPWPSMVSGSIVSRIISDNNKLKDILSADRDSRKKVVESIVGKEMSLKCLGIYASNNAWFPMPADLVCFKRDGNLFAEKLEPRELDSIFNERFMSLNSRNIPALDMSNREKPEKGIWMSISGWRKHLDGSTPNISDLANSSDFWSVQSRLGIGMSPLTRVAEEGLLYTTETVDFKPGMGLLAGFSGNGIPQDGLVRLGGDGHGAEVSEVKDTLKAGLEEIGKPNPGWSKFRMILTTPGMFPQGWLPLGVKEHGTGQYKLEIGELVATLECAAVPRHGTVSGWDLALGKPKQAELCVPAGSVYWFKVEQGSGNNEKGEPAIGDALNGLWQEGLYSLDKNNKYLSRKREGFARVWFGSW